VSNHDNTIKARVFISCGQNKDTGETDVANQILRRMEKMGFEPYVATEEQSLKGIKENVFAKIEESEYFVFVDFKREKLENGEYRGSLFSHQELAIASFFDKDILAFQEKGVKKNDGILGTIQGNSIAFSDRPLLASVIADKISQLNWKTDWRNELAIDRNEREYTDGHRNDTGWRRWYHIEVENLHYKKIALDCIAYLESSKNVLTGEEKHFTPVEFKWRGLNVARTVIPPHYTRGIDAFLVPHKTPNVAYFAINHTLVDFGGFYEEYSLRGPGRFEINFVVFSINFSPIRRTFLLDIGSKLDDIKFRKKNE
jgi:hypothetical protein